jgi:hypothetical protein
VALEVATATAEELMGVVAAQDVPRPGGQKGYAFRKGQVLSGDDLAAVRGLDRPTIHVVRPDDEDVLEDAAGLRLARAIAGPGLSIAGPSQSRYNLMAEQRGLLRVDVPTLAAINSIDGLAVFTLFDRQPVESGEIVAGAKIAPLAIPEGCLQQAERLATTTEVVRLATFRPCRIATLYREKLAPAARERFAEAVQAKAAWFGSTADSIVSVSDDPAAIAATLHSFVRAGADVIFAAGGSSVDPIDATIVALDQAGATLVRRGAPVHPGSMFWLAELEGVPVLSLASCSLFSQATIVDLILPRVLAGERINADDLAAIGHGGLMERQMEWRFPAYARVHQPR